MTQLTSACAPGPQLPSQASDDQLRTAACNLLARMRPGLARVERRSVQRVPFPFLLRLTPLGETSLHAIHDEIVVVGKDFSEQGIGFYHDAPLPYRRARLTFEDAQGEEMSVLVDLTWCRFNQFGWYENGGRFLRLVSPAAA